MKVQLATRMDTGLRKRLRIYSAVTGRTVEDVVTAALDGYLPPTADMIRGEVALGEDPLLGGEPEVA